MLFDPPHPTLNLTIRRLHNAYDHRSNRRTSTLPKQLAEATAIAEGAWLCARRAEAAAAEMEGVQDVGPVRAFCLLCCACMQGRRAAA